MEELIYIVQDPDQHVHCFHALSHLSVPQSCKSILSTNFAFVFTLEYLTTQLSIWIVSWVIFKILWLLCKLTYIFAAIDFFGFAKIQISIFTYQKISQIFRESLCRPLSGMSEIEKLSPISIKYTNIYYLCTLLDAQWLIFQYYFFYKGDH